MSKQQSTSQDEEDDDEDLAGQHPASGILKCPSAPNIHQHKLYTTQHHHRGVPSMLVTPAASAGLSNEGKANNLTSSSSLSKNKKQQSISSNKASRVKLSLSPLPDVDIKDDSAGNTAAAAG